MAKVTIEDLRQIKTGSTVVFTVDKPKEIDTVKSMAYRLTALEPEMKKRYSCSADFKNRKVSVTANPL